MNRFSRMHLTPDVAMRSLESIDLEEKSRIAEGIALIAVLDHRRDYLAAGYSCMSSYCMDRLHMSEDKAWRRIQVARVALLVPGLFEYLADGRLSVTTAAVLAPHLKPETGAVLLEAAAFRTKWEIARLLAARKKSAQAASLGPADEPLVETSSCQPAPAQVILLAEPGAEPACGSTEPSPALVANSRRGRVSPSEAGFDVRLSITEEEHEDLRQAQALLGHAVPSGDPALVYARAMKHYLAHLKKQRLGVKPGTPGVRACKGRGIPKSLRRFVWERDGARCAFASADGHRCEETRSLEIDHIVPVAKGGETTSENLRLLCRAHNQFEAERVLGKEHVACKRELAQRERARAKAAAEATAARANARDAATQVRNDDLVAALRSLGFSARETRRGVEIADAMPDAALDACVKAALAELTRAVAMRGERRARSTA